MDNTAIKAKVKEKYGKAAKSKDVDQKCACSCGQSCCGSNGSGDTRFVDYGETGKNVVAGADLGLGCGIPTKHANIQQGDVVLDLGCGAGVDAFLASRSVGPKGRVVGVDMTPEMINRAKENAKSEGYDNVEFRLGDIESLPLDNESVDVVISNCVINLAPDKHRVFSEIYRVLRSGGRFTISDIVAYGTIPEKIRKDLDQWAGCVAGAMDRDDYINLVKKTGFTDVRISDSVEYDKCKGENFGFMSITLEGVKR